MNTPKLRQQWIYDYLIEHPYSTYTSVFALYSERYGKSSKTFDKDWLKARHSFEEFQNRVQQEKDDVRIKLERDFVKNGLRTKYERVLLIQNQIDETVKELSNGVFKEVRKEGKKAVTWERPLTPSEKATLRRTIWRLQSEISKIEGDYAEMKVKHSNDPENPIEASQVVIFQIPDNGRNSNDE